jgi:hypothetical protein
MVYERISGILEVRKMDKVQNEEWRILGCYAVWPL